MSGELLKMMAKIDLQHVPYRGAGPMLNDLIGGHVKMAFDNMPSAIGHIRGGTVQALAVTTPSRWSGLPEVPTMAESGVPGYDVSAARARARSRHGCRSRSAKPEPAASSS